MKALARRPGKPISSLPRPCLRTARPSALHTGTQQKRTLDEARAGGRNGGFIEPVIDALAERTGLPKSRIMELERGSRSYLVDIGSLVRQAVVELWRQNPQAVKWIAAEPFPQGGCPYIQHVRSLPLTGRRSPSTWSGGWASAPRPGRGASCTGGT